MWSRFGRADWLRIPTRVPATRTRRWAGFVEALRQDLLHTGGLLVAGAAVAATLSVFVPVAYTARVAGIPWLSVVVLAALAVVMSICSEADAFVATSLTQFSMTAKPAFLVIGPMVDLKLIALQAGTFGARFALRFGPLTFVLGVGLGALGSGLLHRFAGAEPGGALRRREPRFRGTVVQRPGADLPDRVHGPRVPGAIGPRHPDRATGRPHRLRRPGGAGSPAPGTAPDDLLRRRRRSHAHRQAFRFVRVASLAYGTRPVEDENRYR